MRPSKVLAKMHDMDTLVRVQRGSYSNLIHPLEKDPIMNTNIKSTLKGFPIVIFYCADPGAFFIMEPVYLELKNNGRQVQWVFDGWCQKNVSTYEFIEYDLLMSRIDSFDAGKVCIIIGKRSHNIIRNWELMRKSRKRKLYSIFFVDYWSNYLDDFLINKVSLSLPDKIWIMDKEARLTLIKQILPYLKNEKYCENIIIAGHPGIEKTVEIISKISELDLNILKNRFTTNKRIVLVVLEPLRKDRGIDANGLPLMGYDEFSFLSYFADNYNCKNMKVIIKPHPRQDVSKIKQFIDESPAFFHINYELVDKSDLNELIAIADEVVGMTSTVLILAMKCGKKITSIQPDRNEIGRELAPDILEPFTLIG